MKQWFQDSRHQATNNSDPLEVRNKQDKSYICTRLLHSERSQVLDQAEGIQLKPGGLPEFRDVLEIWT